MFWIIASFFCAIGLIWSLIKQNDLVENFVIACIIIGVMTTGMGVVGGLRSVSLEGIRNQVLALESEIVNIKNSRYDKVKSGCLVGGSLDNQNQAVAVTEYISRYAEEKAIYNRCLTETKSILKQPLFWAIGINIFMNSNDINKMELL